MTAAKSFLIPYTEGLDLSPNGSPLCRCRAGQEALFFPPNYSASPGEVSLGSINTYHLGAPELPFFLLGVAFPAMRFLPAFVKYRLLGLFRSRG